MIHPRGGRQTRFAVRQDDRECGAVIYLTFDPYLAAMQIDQLAHESKSDARSFMRASVLTLNTMEALEDVRQFA